MNKLKMHSVNKVDENIEKIGALFPNALTEVIKGYKDDGSAIVEPAIDFDVLRQELSSFVVEGPEERYQFTWPDKKNSILLANAPIAKTLRPCREESVDFDGTENLYIEGDNLDALKLLQETYLGKVKMIYIDPPYNTGNDFVYEDDFAQDTDEYLANSGQYDEDGYRLVANLDSNGRFHTDWLNMIYPRLKLSKDLLTIDGVIFISIGDGEVSNLKKMCDEVFGATNCIGIVPRLMKTGGNKGRFFSPNIDYVLVYAKNISVVGDFKGELDQKLIDKLYNKIETEGERKGERYRPFGLYQSSLDARPNQRYYIECPDGTFVIPPGTAMPEQVKDGYKVLPNQTDGCWRWSSDRYLEEKARGNLVFIESQNEVLITPDSTPAKWNVYTKIWLKNREDEGQTPTNFISRYENRQSAKELKELKIAFDFAKPSNLIKYLVSLIDDTKEDIILDFFSGSATTAHAVMQLNAEDDGNRKFIMVQLPEETEEKSEAFKAGYKNICEIGKERIRRAGKKIISEIEQSKSQLKLGEDQKVPDIGFRVLKVDSTNMQDVYYNPAQYEQDKMLLFADNIRPDRTAEDLLFQVMLDLGVLLSSKIEETTIGGKMVFNVADGYLLACFDYNVTSEVITEIAEKQPYYAVFRDSSMASDSVATNFEQIFATYSPTTVRKVL
ncbi:MAG: site-specific DNA-methyltransferase [Syntrophomonas sp.]|nr:site-specific DNA-methyltransferase [Syntrophomonas sp.]